jgi:hypothetical protein
MACSWCLKNSIISRTMLSFSYFVHKFYSLLLAVRKYVHNKTTKFYETECWLCVRVSVMKLWRKRLFIIWFEVLKTLVINIPTFWDIQKRIPMWTPISEEIIISIFRVEICLATCRTLVLGRLISPLKLKVIRSSETSVPIRTTKRYIPEDGNIHIVVSLHSGISHPLKSDIYIA